MAPRTKLQRDGVRKLAHYGFPRAPFVQGDVVRKRSTQVDQLDHLKRGNRTLKRKEYPGSVVVHVSFTLTTDLDQRIHDYAVKRDCSRSAVVRQALLTYFSQVEA